MKAFEIKLCWIVRDSMKSACCSVLKDQWLAIVVGFVISTTWLKPMGFHGQTAEACESVDAIRSKKYINLGAISAFGSVLLPLLGPPLTAYYRLLSFSDRKKASPSPRATSASKQWFQKVLLLRKSNLNFGQNAKWWGGPSSFYGRKVGYFDITGSPSCVN